MVPEILGFQEGYPSRIREKLVIFQVLELKFLSHLLVNSFDFLNFIYLLYVLFEYHLCLIFLGYLDPWKFVKYGIFDSPTEKNNQLDKPLMTKVYKTELCNF